MKDCAWWSRRYRGFEKDSNGSAPLSGTIFYFLLKPNAFFVKRLFIANLFEALTSTRTDDNEGDHGNDNDLDRAVKWTRKAATSRTGITVFVIWLVVFAYYIFKCQKRRAYAKAYAHKRDGSVEISL